ncbi:MAG: hypothetical protein QNK23_05730 [Crocinitomicaceae bacterium]|nr:hypothetical protein [Crocinitomicaceae bacterium]
MKKVFLGSALFLGLLLVGCSSGDAVEGEDAEGGEEEVAAMTCADLESQVDELEGQEVTITAISWGNSNTIDGDVKMNLGDVALEGMQQAHVVANFSADNADAANGVEKDATVTIKATVGGSEYGAVQLNDPEIVK